MHCVIMQPCCSISDWSQWSCKRCSKSAINWHKDAPHNPKDPTNYEHNPKGPTKDSTLSYYKYLLPRMLIIDVKVCKVLVKLAKRTAAVHQWHCSSAVKVLSSGSEVNKVGKCGKCSQSVESALQLLFTRNSAERALIAICSWIAAHRDNHHHHHHHHHRHHHDC